MDHKSLNHHLGNIDIYLLDQILKGRFEGKNRILDAGCGEGRNLRYFINNGYEVFGIDTNPMAIRMLAMMYKSSKEHFRDGKVEELDWEDGYFDAVISSAVLHFARDKEHFNQMMSEMVRVLKPGGFLFARIACDVGVEASSAGRNGFTYLLSNADLAETLEANSLRMIDPFKTVVVEDKRSMSVLALEK